MKNPDHLNTELTLTSSEMKWLGQEIISLVIDHFDKLHGKEVLNIAAVDELRDVLLTDMPSEGRELSDVVSQIQTILLGNLSHGDHPKFFAFVPGPSNFVGAMADALVAGFNVCASNWLEASSFAEIERITIEWLARMMGYSNSAGGHFVSGGSMANLTAIAVAREIKLGNPDPEAIVYYSDQTHISVERGLKVLGFSREQMRRISTDDSFRIDSNDLIEKITADRKENLRPFCLIANVGTTNTGAVDPIAELFEICSVNDMWLHLDAAYGGAAVLTQNGKSLLGDLSLADSITIDPHKWLFQPIECGCLLVKDRSWLRAAFDTSPEYLSDVDEGIGEINYYQEGIQLTRQSRALKLWMSLQVFGVDAFSSAVEQGIENAKHVEKKLSELECWEIISPATLGIVVFRYNLPSISVEDLDSLNQKIADKLTKSGIAFIGTTLLNGLRVLRMCTINPRTSIKDLDETIVALDNFAKEQHVLS